MTSLTGGSSPASPSASALRRIYDYLYFNLLPLTQPADLCVVIFSVTVAALFFKIDQPFNWYAFWAFIKDPFVWFAILMAPLMLILITEDRVGDHYDLKKSTFRFTRGFRNFLRDFMPYLICLVIYLNLADVVDLVSPVKKDPQLIAIDQALFGVQVSQWMQRFSNPWLDEWMNFTYVIFGWYPLTLGAFFLARGQRKAFRDLALAYIMASFIGYFGYVAVPAIGPRYYLEYSVDIRGMFFASVEWAMHNTMYIDSDCFPSLHTANTLVVLGIARLHRRGLFWGYLPFGICTVISTMYLRKHYAIDVIAGIALAAFVVAIAPRWNTRWEAWTARIRAQKAARDGVGRANGADLEEGTPAGHTGAM